MRYSTPIALVGLALVAACNDGTGTGANMQRVTLSFNVAQPGASFALVPGGASAATDASGRLVVTKAQLVLEKIKLESDEGTACTDDSSSSVSASAGASFGTPSYDEGADDGVDGSDDDGDGCAEVEIEDLAVLVDLPVDGGVVTPVIGAIPAGSYGKLQLRVHKPEDSDQNGAAFIAAHPEFSDVSIRVEGTYDGQPFVYTTDLNADLEMGFDPPIQIADGSLNVTVNVDVTGWFDDGSGNAVDPRTAAKGGANESRVEENIERSFHAFEDEDHDGHDDHGADL